MVDWIRLADQLGLRKVSSMCEMHLARYGLPNYAKLYRYHSAPPWEDPVAFQLQ
jgi:hypothetical protein